MRNVSPSQSVEQGSACGEHPLGNAPTAMVITVISGPYVILEVGPAWFCGFLAAQEDSSDGIATRVDSEGKQRGWVRELWVTGL